MPLLSGSRKYPAAKLSCFTVYHKLEQNTIPVAGDIILRAALILAVAGDMPNFTACETLAVILHVHFWTLLGNVTGLPTSVA